MYLYIDDKLLSKALCKKLPKKLSHIEIAQLAYPNDEKGQTDLCLTLTKLIGDGLLSAEKYKLSNEVAGIYRFRGLCYRIHKKSFLKASEHMELPDSSILLDNWTGKTAKKKPQKQTKLKK